MFQNFPDFDKLYYEVRDFILENQGEDGYIDCRPGGFKLKDTIYAIVLDEVLGYAVEEYVYGVRVRGDSIQVILEPIANTYKVDYEDSDFHNEDAWLSLRYSDVYRVYTLIAIAESIEQYV